MNNWRNSVMVKQVIEGKPEVKLSRFRMMYIDTEIECFFDALTVLYYRSYSAKLWSHSSARSGSYGLRNLLDEEGGFCLDDSDKAPIIARSGDVGESYPDPLPLPVKLLSEGACQVDTGRVSASFSRAAAERSVGERAQGSVLSR